MTPETMSSRHSGVAGGDQALSSAYPADLPQRGHRIVQMLQHLMGVHDVEASSSNSTS